MKKSFLRNLTPGKTHTVEVFDLAHFHKEVSAFAMTGIDFDLFEKFQVRFCPSTTREKLFRVRMY